MSLIVRIWKSQPGAFFCVSSKSASGDWRDTFFKRSELKQADEFIEDNKDKDLYFCPHGFTEKRRKEEFAVMPSLLWADLDEADPREVDIKPTVAIESSPGRYVGLWFIDTALDDKETNKRLSYFLDADHGGWDITQVLRIPGTTNYKYKSTPRVRTLWTDGPVYTLKEIKKQLPVPEEVEDDDAQEIYAKYEKNMEPWLRRELLKGSPTPGKRSEMMWKLANSLVEMGISQDECFTLLKASPWNKFQGRDNQLRKEIKRAGGKKFKTKKHSEESSSDYKFLTRPMSEVEEEEIDWIWYPYLARGELSILEGDPGLGKSYLAQMISLAIVDGDRLPSVKRMPPVQGKVAYFDLENSAGSVTKKRLAYNGCENLEDYYQEEEPFSIDDEERFEAVLKAIETLKPTLVVFDTLNTYIGKADIHKSSETQQAFAHFREIAKRFNCSVLVLRHLTKGTKERALYRGQGSIAFTGLARVVMTVGVLPEDEDTRVMAVTKLNITRLPKALTFTILALPDRLKEHDRSRFKWGEFVDFTSDDIIAAPTKPNGDRKDATTFLEDLLKKGPVEVTKIEQAGEGRSVSWRTIQRAADEMNIIRKTNGFGKEKKTTWELK